MRSTESYFVRFFGDDLDGDPGATSIGEQDAEEQESLNEEYEDKEDEARINQVIDTNPPGTPPTIPQHGLVEEGPGPDA